MTLRWPAHIDLSPESVIGILTLWFAATVLVLCTAVAPHPGVPRLATGTSGFAEPWAVAVPAPGMPALRGGDVGSAYARMALVSQDHGDYEGAQALLHRALVLRTLSYGKSSPEVAATFARLGLLLDEREHYAAAERATQQAIFIWRGLRNPDPAVHVLLLAQLARIRCHRVYAPVVPACELEV